MKNMYRKFPELILVDATYKLLDLRMPVYLVLCIDGNGLSEIVAMFILAEETKAVIEAAVGVFRKLNPACNETKVVMSDKDFTEREAFTSCFPGASLNICLFHTLRSFRREITCEKMGITSAERHRCLEVLTGLAYFKSPEAFDRHLHALNNISSSVKEYIELNWIPIKDQWVSCFKDNTLNLGERTNNRLETTFSKIKSVCSKYASLVQFFHEFFSVLASLRSERSHHYLMALTRRPIDYGTMDETLQLYSDLLTPYSFNFVREQFIKASTVSRMSQTAKETFEVASTTGHNPVSTTAETCTCSFAKRMGLPCRHIFRARTILKLPLFESSLPKKRWTKDFYMTLKDSRFLPESVVADDGQSVFTEDCPTPQVFLSALDQEERVLSQAQKFRKGLQAGQIIASLASEGGMARFRNRYQLLQDLISYWKLGTEVVITPLKNSKDLEQAIHEVPETVVNSEIAVEDYHEISDQAVLESLAHGPDIPEQINIETNKQACSKLSLNLKSEITEDSINGLDACEE